MRIRMPAKFDQAAGLHCPRHFPGHRTQRSRQVFTHFVGDTEVVFDFGQRIEHLRHCQALEMGGNGAQRQ